ncbi:MAG TPA: L,D-transpeptidase family protein [Segeticoccus sp.]|uniref:L,D-transpeptidase family protein n=1 Tax=Segeticoccus sp. TaxID=2706531 RepID=UPI002D7EDC2A|nr:L,D-transpeptidase family protein [Segeticoccus sp.]HET8599900.1 L,D-transpeptidase family protein [Segeticoccus sp.]
MELTRRGFITGATGLAAGGALALVGALPALAVSHPTLRYGSRGAAVVTLQRRLNALRYWCGAADGVFGGLTQQAVLAIQKVAGLVRDGICGPVTWSRLDAGVRAGPRTRSGYWVEIDKRHQVLLVVDNGRLRHALATSTGSGKWFRYGSRWLRAVTPSGSFRVTRSVNGWDYGPLGGLYRPMYFNGGIAVHGFGSVPAYPASHGCCRVSLGAMDMLWRTREITVGRRVLVY